uniref:Uncharacterized protein n=1 Tax=Cacopsylla melanoneura TaxID=428564 RepID=A0A8D8QQA2_9HEMI
MANNMGGMTPFVRGRSPIQYYNQYPGGNDLPPHMHRGPPSCFPEENMSMGPAGCGMMGGEFKSPMISQPEPPPPKKKRRTSNAATITHHAPPPPPPVMQDLLPPPLTGKLHDNHSPCPSSSSPCHARLVTTSLNG